MIKSFLNYFKRIFICEISKHIPIRDIRDNGITITRYSCNRCGCSLGFGKFKYIPKPVWSTMTQEQYNKYVIDSIYEDYKATPDEISDIRNIKIEKLLK